MGTGGKAADCHWAPSWFPLLYASGSLLLLSPLPHLSFPEFRPHGRWWAVDIHTRSQIYADSTEAPDCSSGPGIGDQRPGGLWQGVKTPQLQTLTVTATGGQQQDPV